MRPAAKGPRVLFDAAEDWWVAPAVILLTLINRAALNVKWGRNPEKWEEAETTLQRGDIRRLSPDTPREQFTRH